MRRDRLERLAGVTHGNAHADGGKHLHIVQAVAKRQRLLRGKTERGAGVPNAARLAAVGMKHIHRAGMTAHRAVTPAVLGENRL